MAKALTTTKWKEKAILVHGDKYDYSLVEYVKGELKVVILCKHHGKFEQRAKNHLKGLGCPCCAGNKTPSTEEWALKASQIHGNKYDYSELVYKSARGKVSITCPHHGKFQQLAASHIEGSGCPKCKIDQSKPTDVYMLTNGSEVKIGISVNPKSRLKDMSCRNMPFDARIVSTWTLPNHQYARVIESEIHKRMSNFSANFNGFDGATEWFKSSIDYARGVIEEVISKATSPNLTF